MMGRGTLDFEGIAIHRSGELFEDLAADQLEFFLVHGEEDVAGVCSEDTLKG